MELQTLINIAVALLVIVWIGGRQLRWRPITARTMWTLPLIFTVAGIVLVANEVKPREFTAIGLGFLAIEVALSIGIGTLMGVIAQFRPIPEADRAAFVPKRAGDPQPAWQTRTGWVGMVLWVVLIGIRIGLDFYGESIGAGTLLVSTGTILFVVGINRIVRTAVIAYRMSRHELVEDVSMRSKDARTKMVS